MALVLPILRLWLLLLNIYGTFKAMKPPIPNKSGRGPSGRAMQLKKRELKSRLAVWILWASFCILEPPLDRTIGFFTPFYNELKCTILLFLLASRAHGAEAIFLHIIHPFLRPYVPVIDDILSVLHSVLELLTLLAFLPWEFMLYSWYRSSTWFWSLIRKSSTNIGDSDPPQNIDSQSEDEGEGPGEIRRRLRPRVVSDRVQLVEAHQSAHSVFRKIDEAQERVRIQTRAQFAASGYGHQSTFAGAPLRTRRRLLEQVAAPSQEIQLPPGSKSTSVLHLDPIDSTQPGQDPKLFQSNIASDTPVIPTVREFYYTKQFEQSTSSRSIRHPTQEIWYPPLSSFEERERDHTPSLPRQVPKRTPSPIYPPLPAAYPFTPQIPRRNSLPLQNPLPTPAVRRRIVSGGTTHELIDPSEFQTDEAQVGPSTFLGSVNRDSRGPENLVQEDFQKALDPSIQPIDMDVDTEILSMRNGSSAKGQSTDEDSTPTLQEYFGENTLKQRSRRQKQELGSRGKKGKSRGHEDSLPLRRSTRSHDRTTAVVERDEFGFTIGSNRNSTDTTSTLNSDFSSQQNGMHLSRKKPLARTKPGLKPTPEEVIMEESSDEESIKKKRRLKVDKPAKENVKTIQNDTDDRLIKELKGDTAQKDGKPGPSLREGRAGRYYAKRVGGRLLTEGGQKR